MYSKIHIFIREWKKMDCSFSDFVPFLPSDVKMDINVLLNKVPSRVHFKRCGTVFELFSFPRCGGLLCSGSFALFSFGSLALFWQPCSLLAALLSFGSFALFWQGRKAPTRSGGGGGGSDHRNRGPTRIMDRDVNAIVKTVNGACVPPYPSARISGARGSSTRERACSSLAGVPRMA